MKRGYRHLVGVRVAALFFLLVAGCGFRHGSASAAEIGPEDAFCPAANALAPGEELVLRPGNYHGPCVLVSGGLPGAPVVIRAADLQRRPRLLYRGRDANVLDIRASHITVRGLAIGPSSADVDGIRVFSTANVVIEDCEFDGIGGVAVAATHNSIAGLVVRRNIIENSESTAMYFGCHDGLTCTVSGLLVERNFIRTVRAPNPEIGYGIQVKLNSTAVMRDNVILNTKGPGIMVYGSRDLLNRSVVERNLVMGSQTSSGIVVGGGPAAIRNNISLLNHGAGIALEDYHVRGLLRSVIVSHNTLYKNAAGGVTAPAGVHVRDVAITNNAVHTLQGAPAVPRGRVDVDLAGNVDCTWALCFANPEAMDFSPVNGSLLLAPASMRGADSVPPDDYFGTKRSLLPVAGAIQRGAGAIRLGPKP
ncbi:MAG: right-handed parallel beta-helix repeat-containing protein [bacterium]